MKKLLSHVGQRERVSRERALFARLYFEGRLGEARALADRERARGHVGAERVAWENNAATAAWKMGDARAAFDICADALPLAEACDDDVIAANLHNTFALACRARSEAEGDETLLDLALIQYEAAHDRYRHAGGDRFAAGVDNNIAFLMIFAGRAEDAHPYLDRARAVFEALGERARCAEIDDTRARALMQEGRWLEALGYSAQAVAALAPLAENGERQAFDDAAETHGRALEECRRRGLVKG